MDVRGWKNILLQWVSECGFSDRNYYNIEQSDIDGFFKSFCKRHKTLNSEISMSLTEFLREHYPEFEANLDDENALSSAEYVYMYSLFLHFSCVKYPEEYFHDSCQKLSELSQQCIATFFKQLLDCESIKRENLRHAIADVAGSHLSPQQRETFNGASGLVPNSSRIADSPARTPTRSVTNAQRISPTTPKTFLLEERTRELYSLRAQLETERYEKGLLEVQIKQNEDKILKLNHDHKKLQQHIQNLKNDILTKNSDSHSPVRDDDAQQIKRRLCKEIAQKDQEISKINDVMSTLMEEKQLVEEKRKYAEKKITLCLDRIQALTSKVDELTASLEQKNNTIKFLTDNKTDLERFIAETRLASNAARTDLNTSAECLDTSFTQTHTNSSGSILSSPENLGCSVVDKQLREKESENHQLQAELTEMRASNSRLAQHIQQLATKYSEECDITIERMASHVDIYDPAEHFKVFASCMDQLSKSYKNDRNRIKQLQDNACLMEEKNADLCKRVENFEREVHFLRDTIDNLEMKNVSMQKSKLEMQDKLTGYEKDIDKLNKQKLSLVTNLEGLVRECHELKEKFAIQENDYHGNIKQLHADFKVCRKETETLCKQNSQYIGQIDALQNKVKSLEGAMSEKTAEYDLAFKSLGEKLNNAKKETEDHQAAEHTVKEKYEKLLIKYEEKKKKSRETDDHLETMRDSFAKKELEMSKLGTEIVEVLKKNTELENRIDEIMHKYNREKETACLVINNKDACIREIRGEKEQLKVHLEGLQREHEKIQQNYENSELELQTVYGKANALKALLNLPTGECGLVESFDSIVGKLAEFTELTTRMAEKIETLEFDSLETVAEMKLLEEQLKKSTEENNQHEEDIRKAKMQLDLKQAKITDYEQQIQSSSKEQTNHKEQLQTVNAQLQREYDEKLQCFETKVEKFTSENACLIEEIRVFKEEHTKIEKMLKEAGSSTLRLSEQLQQETAEKSELILKLETSEKCLLQTQAELEETLQEHRIQAKNLRHAEEQFLALDKLLSEQTASIGVLNTKLQKLTEEKELLSKDSKAVTARLLNEQDDREALIQSLERTVERLNGIVEEKARKGVQLERCGLDMKGKITEADEKINELQTALLEKQNELQVCLQKQREEQEDWQSKMTDLMGRLAEQSADLNTYEIILIDMMSNFESSTNMASEENDDEINNVFKASQNECESTVNLFRKTLNRMFYNFTLLQANIKEAEQKEKKAYEMVDALQESNNKLNNQLKRHKTEIDELKDELASEAKAVGTNLTNELARLMEDMKNLENVNEQLSGENAALQLKLAGFEEEIGIVKLENEKMKEESAKKQQDIQQATDERVETLMEQCSHLEKELAELNKKCVTSDIERSRVIKKNEQLQAEISQTQKHLNTSEQELHKKSEQYQLLLKAHESTEKSLAKGKTDLSALRDNLNTMTKTCASLEVKLKDTTHKLDDTSNLKSASEKKYAHLNSQFKQLQREMDKRNVVHATALKDTKSLEKELAALKVEKAQLNGDLMESKRELQRANDNISELIQQIGSTRAEKDAAADEIQMLEQQLEEKSTIESKTKAIVERSQELEVKLVGSENELKSIRAHLNKSKYNAEQLCVENKRLRESLEAATKRVEKLALKLGENQARVAKLERENDKLAKTLENRDLAFDTLQREKDMLHVDVKTLKERAFKAERSQEQLMLKVDSLEMANISLKEAKEKLEVSEIDVKAKLSKLEKMRDTNEEKIRKLNNALDSTEQANVRLNLEIGGLNSKLLETKKTASTEHSQIEEITKNLNEAKNQAQKFEDLSDTLRAEAEQLREKNADISDQLSKVSLSLQISKEKCEALAREMEQLRADLLILREEKSQVEQKHVLTCAKLQDFTALNEQLIADRQELVAALEAKVAALQAQLATKTLEAELLRKEVETLRNSTSSAESTATYETESLRARLSAAEAMLEKEQQATAQLRLDNQILQAKYQEAKQRMVDESQASEERIKENRLELEGKLEKMKNKMKALYAEEITKQRGKQDRESANTKMEMDVLRSQNTKYEEHTRKLSAQIVRLNEKILQQQKENVVLSTKLKHVEDNAMQFKRPNSMHGSMISSTNHGSNLAMEDEEGEVFNNTYLTDLKAGRMSEYMNRDIRPEELQFRNSLLPPHLKSTYAAQLAEDDLKDGPSSLDDSMSALLSNTTGGAVRKKISGVTLYKRPGPPTPSKNGGRLSFGSYEPAREILKECDYGNAGTVSSTKTPTRFTFFTSRFSIGNSRDEPICLDLRKAVQMRNLQALTRSGAGALCTSTPRKSVLHTEQRQLLEQLNAPPPQSSSPLTPVDYEVLQNVTPPDVSIIETPVTTQQRPLPSLEEALRKKRATLPKRRLSRRFHKGASPLAQDTTSSAQTNTPRRRTPGTTSGSGQSRKVNGSLLHGHPRLRRRSKRERSARPSFYLCGNIFAKHRSSNRNAERDLIRNRARKQRNEAFNALRMLKSLVDSPEGNSHATYDLKTNKTMDCNPNGFGKTTIIAREEQPTPQEWLEEEDESVVSDLACTDDLGTEIKTFCDDDVKRESIEYIEYEHDGHGHDDDRKMVPIKLELEHIKEELVTLEDLEEFDKRLSLVLQRESEVSYPEYSAGNSEHFERLLAETASAAPFQVNELQYTDVITLPPSLPGTSSSDGMPSTSSLAFAPCSTAISMASITSQTSGTMSSVQHSRTIYGGSVIYNRRIPNIHITNARKSSIYIKNRDPNVEDDIILVTNQTITLLDLVRMWSQMDRATRLMIAFALVASVTTFMGLVYTFLVRR